MGFAFSAFFLLCALVLFVLFAVDKHKNFGVLLFALFAAGCAIGTLSQALSELPQ